MPGKDATADRLAAMTRKMLDRLDLEVAAFVHTPPEPGALERTARIVRAAAAAGKALAELQLSIGRLRAVQGARHGDLEEDADDARADGDVDAFDSQDEEADEDPPAAQDDLEALRAEVARRYARFDHRPGGAWGEDGEDGSPGAEAGEERLGGHRERSPAAAA